MDNEPKKYTKLSVLVGDTFKVEEVGGYTYKRWNPAESKMETSDTYQEGFRKVYPLTTNKGQLDVGSGQLGNLLEAVFNKGKADLIGRTFEVKSNGKMGMDVRYFFNPIKDKAVDTVVEPIEGEPISLEGLPF